MVDFKIYDFKNSITNNAHRQIFQAVKTNRRLVACNVKFGKLIKFKMKNIFSKIVQKLRQEDQLQTFFCFFKKLYMRKKQVTCTLVLIYFGSPRLEYNKNELSILVLKKVLGIDSPPHFVHDFSRKMFLMLYSNNRPNFIAW